MGFGFVIERFNLFLSALRHESENPGRHIVSLLVGVLLILLGATVAFVSSMMFRRFVKTLPANAIPPRYWIGLGFLINLLVSLAGLCLAGYLLIGAAKVPDRSYRSDMSQPPPAWSWASTTIARPLGSA